MGTDPAVLVTGAGGQVGRALGALWPGARLASHSDLDITDAASVHETARGADVVVHLAAMTNVDACEDDAESAIAVNDEGTKNVVGAARAHGARVIYLSTDYVFDGRKTDAYIEADRPNPINVYGRSKLAGETHVAELPGSLIMRTSWVYGEGRNFVAAILAAARARRTLEVVDDQHGRPTWAADIARAIAHAVHDEITGVIHLSGDGPVASWAEVAEAALGAAELPVDVTRIDSRTYAASAGRKIAPRPANSMLSLERAKELRFPIVDWRESIRAYVRRGA